MRCYAMARGRARGLSPRAAPCQVDVFEVAWIPSDPLMTTRPPGARVSLFVALIGLGMLGATCKGNENRQNASAQNDTKGSKTNGQKPAERAQITDIEGVDVSVIEPSR